MDHHEFMSESVSPRVWKNMVLKFYELYDQVQLRDFYNMSVPVFVRYNNRNIYGFAGLLDGRFVVSNLYRLARDGSPVKFFIDFKCDLLDCKY